MKEITGKICKQILLVPLAALILTAFLTVCYCIPLDEVNYSISVEELGKQGWYTDVLALRPGYAENFYSEQPGIQNVSDDLFDYYRAKGYSDKGPLYNAVAMGYDGEEHYARYWHGYAGFLRILLRIFDCNEIKFLSFAFQFVLVLLAAIFIKEKGGILLSLLFASQYLLLMPLVVSVCVPYLFSIDVSLLGVLLMVKFHDRMEDKNMLGVFFCLIGIFTCFFELLIFGVLSFGVVVQWMVLLYGKDKTRKENLLSVVKSGLSWIWGYGGIWFMKWVIATMVLGEDIISDGFNTVLFRSSSTDATIEESVGYTHFSERFLAISANYKYYCYAVYFLILAFWVVFFTVKLVRKKMRADSRIPAMVLVALGPIVWYLTLANHTMGHRFFTHRIFNFGIIAVLMVLFMAGNGKVKETLKADKALIFKAVMLVCSIALALVITSFKTEEFEFNRADMAGEAVPFAVFDGGVFSTSFVPQGDVLKTLGVALTPAGTEGYYELRLLKDGTVFRSSEIPFETFADSSWQMLELDWKVKPGNSYTFEMIPVCEAGTEGTVAICYPEAPAAMDFGYLQPVTGREYTALTHWIVYDRHVTGRTWMFYFLTWFAIFECLGLLLWNVLNKETADEA